MLKIDRSFWAPNESELFRTLFRVATILMTMQDPAIFETYGFGGKLDLRFCASLPEEQDLSHISPQRTNYPRARRD